MTPKQPLMTDELRRLAERAERESSEGEREMLGEAAYAIWGDEADQPPETLRDFWDRATHFVAKLRAFAFTDAAMMLVPEDRPWTVKRFKGWAEAWIGGSVVVKAATPALALCAAALRAKSEEGSGK